MIALLLLAWLQVADAAEELRRFALLVAANDGGDARVTLRYAHDDASAVGGVLTELGGVAPTDLDVLLEPDPVALDAAFDALGRELAAAGDRAEVVFYYSGHSDEIGLLLGGETYGYRALRERLDALPAKVRIAILDSCASGALIRAKGGTLVAPFLVDEATEVDGVAFITSSSEDEVAQEADRIGGSYFTHALTTGLRGAADMSRDGRVTLYEAYKFAFDETLARTERSRHGPQHAKHEFQLSGAGDLVLTQLQRTDATLVLEEPLEGRALVRDDRGRLVAELRKEVGTGVELGLPAGRYAVTLARDDGRYGVADVVLLGGESTPLPADALVWADGELAVARGGEIETPVYQIRAELVPGYPALPPGEDWIFVSPTWGRSPRLAGLGAAVLGVHAVALDGATFAFGWSSAERGRGAQLGMVYNGVREDFGGFQGSFGVNHVGGRGSGLQLGALNHGARYDGGQIGLINVGGHVRGAQLGLINVARNVDGLQLGLINVARDVRGVPIGLLSIERQGRHDLLVYADDLDLINVELKLGGDWLHTILGGGASPGDHVELHAGLGGHLRLGPVWLDLDAVSATYGDARDLVGRAPTTIGSARATLGLEIVQQVQPFAGVSANVPLSADATDPVRLGKGDAAAWPGVHAGLAFRPIPNDRPTRGGDEGSTAR